MSYKTLLYTMALLFTLFMSPLANSGELRPLNLPSTQQQHTAPAQSYAPASPASPAVPARPTVYDRFRAEVAGLSAQQKDEYRTRFQGSLSESNSRGDWAAAAYYQELLTILN